MKSLYKMTKEQLVAECKRLKSENERLQYELDNLSDYCCDVEHELADSVGDNVIKDFNWFKFRLAEHNLLTAELEDFIESYLKFNNV